MLILFFGRDDEQIAGTVHVSDAFAATHDKQIEILAQRYGFTLDTRDESYATIYPPGELQDDLGAIWNYLANLMDPS